MYLENKIVDEMKETLNNNLEEVLSIFNKGKPIQNKKNLKECIKKCKRLQVELSNSIKLIEYTYMVLQTKSEHTHLALNNESNYKNS